MRKRVYAICIAGCVFALLMLIFKTTEQDGTLMKKSVFTINRISIKSFDRKTSTPTSSHVGATAATDSASPSIAVIVLTYMRSGSSLVGDILQQSPGAFYIYEPLHVLQFMSEEKSASNITYVNGTVRTWPFDFYEEAVNVLRHWLLCDVTKLPRRILMDGFMNVGLQSRKFHQCYNERTSRAANFSQRLWKCALELKLLCQTSPVRIFKTIRMPLKQISHLLEELPMLKIVHLVRDPRATLTSQAHVGMCSLKHGGKFECTDKYCTRVENDISELSALVRHYPYRLKTVLYEDVASSPIETSKEVYDFIGTSFSAHAQEYIYNITLAGNPDNCIICTTRSNSSDHIFAWKKTINEDLLNNVEKRCSYVLRYYNYQSVLNLKTTDIDT